MNEYSSSTGSSSVPAMSKVYAFLALCCLLSCPFWFVIASAAKDPGAGGKVVPYTFALMWCPGVAAVLTRCLFQHNLRGFALHRCKAHWITAALLIPVIFGLIMFGSAWGSGAAPLDKSNLTKVFSFSFIPYFAIGFLVNCFGAFGEELGWRGLLVPELARRMSFSGVALVSSGIWTVWHFPLILFGAYHGPGQLLYSMAAFVVLVMVSGVTQAYFRLASESIWPSVLMHGSWNYFIQMFYPFFTANTPAGEKMLGEFGWFAPSLLTVLLIFALIMSSWLPQPRSLVISRS